MGSIRTLLALSVVLSHARLPGLVGGRMAVQLFYMISGFLISYILTERKSYATAGAFYVNRGLRLVPIYIAMAAITLFSHYMAVTGAAGRDFFETFHSLSWPGRALLAFTNTSIFGQDTLFFLKAESGELRWTSDYRDSMPELWKGLLLPQGWTLALELSFYALAPVVIPRPKLVWGLLISSFGVRALLVGLGLALQDPWSYRFFPTELGLFLVGAVSHQKLNPLCERLKDKLRHCSSGATCFVIGLILGFPFLPRPQVVSILLLGVFALTLPLLFAFQLRYKWDKIIGEYSYPIYMSHMFIIWTLPDMMYDQVLLRLAVTCSATVVFSHLLLRCLGHPVESLRNRFRMTNARR